ncbi:MAG: DegT/DnrJ/EryC1/StrS family aminotransferase [Pseudanabaenaceae cyanobacterium SKYGB_i_bin29]|nr:DegT/DnrJ/EryC1/StrS family aminotransferase [Pseudanabaenaceae cyanobacterium SKYGB_i_bin29]
MRIPIFDLKEQYRQLATEIDRAIANVLQSGQFILGNDVQFFEQEISEYLGVKYAITTNSGTDALMISLRSVGIVPGDEVITTPFSFFATAEAISNIGAVPIFVDVDPLTFNINTQQIRSAITSKTRAILPVHLFGCPANLSDIIAIAQEYNLKVIEDCAQSFGAKYLGCNNCNCDLELRSKIWGKYTGTIGDCGAFSFFPTKNLGAYGDGGLIVTNDAQVAETARKLRVHGSISKYQNEMLGYNSRLDTLQAAILRVKLPYVEKWNTKRREIAYTYTQILQEVKGIITPSISEGHVFHQYTIRVLSGKRQGLIDLLHKEGIGTMIYYPVPLHLLPVYRGQYPSFPIAEQLAQEVLSLPIYPELELKTIVEIAHTIKQCWNCL